MAAAQAALSGQVADQTDRLKELTDRNATLRSKLIDELSRQEAAQQERLAAMRERDAARQTRIEDLVEQKAALNTRIEELTGRIDALTGRHAAQKARIDELKERIAAGQARVEEWRERDRSRQTRLEEQKARILDLQQALNDRDDALTAARAAHSDEVARRKERVEALRSKLRVEREQRADMLASVRWKAGDLVADAVRRPGLRTLALPIRLLMLVLRRSG
ncbi:MAG TPA: hypothetical protein VMS76_12620 [Planctomycetota bacterium]|nr:hypothetical protein [Planctomycetota bacterium]